MRFEWYESKEDIVALIEWHNAWSDFCVIDTETTSKNPREAVLVDIQMSGYDPDHAVAFSGSFLPLLASLTCPQVYQNFKYDWKVMLRHGLDMRGKPMRDTMLLDHLADENRDHDLDSWVQATYSDSYKADFWSRYKTYSEAPPEARLEYSCKDIIYTGRWYAALQANLAQQEVPSSLVDHVHRLALSLYDTEVEGIAVDLGFCMQIGTELKTDIVKTEAELRRLGGFHCEAIELDMWAEQIKKLWKPKGKKWQTHPRPEFNFASPSQVVKLLYEELELPVQMNRKTKKPTTDAKALEKLAPLHPIPAMLMHHSKITTMYGTFIEGVLQRAQGATIYPSFNVNGTVTGRISHSDPNMGNIPSRGEWVKIRGIFVPQPGNFLGTADYGQLEVCIAAHYSQDKNLLRIIHEGASQHDITADGMGIERSLAKTINFAMQYGATHHKIKEILNCSEKDAVAALGKYWETYAGLKKFIDWCHGELDAGRPIANPFGRKRRFPARFSNPWEKASAQRQVFSSLIQGTGGDMMSQAFYRTAERLKARKWGRGWFTVHDEGLIEATDAHFDEAEALLVENMLAIGPEIKLTVPLKVEPSGRLARWEK